MYVLLNLCINVVGLIRFVSLHILKSMNNTKLVRIASGDTNILFINFCVYNNCNYLAYLLVGIVKSVDAKERTAIVCWLKHNESHNNEPQEFDGEENVSVYELVEHPHYTYCLGDVVICLSPESSKSQCKLQNLHAWDKGW